MWSLRDLRTVAVNDELHREFNGEFDSLTRLWSFPSREMAEDAERLTLRQKIHVLHVAGGAALWGTLTGKQYGGVAISAWQPAGQKQRHNSATFVFKDEESFIEARRYAHVILRTTETLEEAERAFGLRADLVYGVSREDLQHRYATGTITQYEHESIEARLCAAAQRTPASAAAEATSLDDAFRMADDWLTSQERALPHRVLPEGELPQRTIEGVLVGRSAYHLVVDTGSELAALRSDRIATPQSYQGVREKSFDVRSPINIAYDERGVGHAIQNRERDDIDIGLLKLSGARAAAQDGLHDILMVDEDYHATYDLRGRVIDKRGALTAVYDSGAFITLLIDPQAAIGTEIRKGPRASGPSYARSR